MCCMQRNILLRHTYFFGVKNFIIYKSWKLIYCRYAECYRGLQYAFEGDCSCSHRWCHLTAISFNSTESFVSINANCSEKVVGFNMIGQNIMLISCIRAMFDSQGHWSKNTPIEKMLQWFPHIVSRKLVVCCMMLRMGYCGFKTGCKSRGLLRMMLTIEWSWFSTVCKWGLRRPFLNDTDNRMVWIFNSE